MKSSVPVHAWQRVYAMLPPIFSEMLLEIDMVEKCDFLKPIVGWSGGAMVLGKLPVPGRPTYLDDSRARAYCAVSGCGWGLFGHFFSRLSFLFSFSGRRPDID